MLSRLIIAAITLPLLFLLPGFAFFKSRRFSPGGMSWIEKILFIVVLSIAVSSIVALALAELGYLRLWLLDVVLATVAIIVRLLFGCVRGPAFLPRPKKRELLLVTVLVILAAALFFRPGEYVGGDADPGYNYNFGYHLATTGSMSVHDKSIPGMSEAEIKISYDSAGYYKRLLKVAKAYDGMQFFAFRLENAKTGTLTPMLPHLLPTWIGIFIMLFGAMGGLYAMPLFGLLAMILVYALARRFSGVPGAVVAMLLGIFCFLQIWFSRTPTSELMCQAFVVASILFLMDLLDSGNAASGVLAALSITCAILARPEAILLAAPMFLVMALEMLQGRYKAGDRVFSNALLFGLAYTWLMWWFYSKFYINIIFEQGGTSNVLFLSMAVLIVMGFPFFNLSLISRRLRRLGTAISGALEKRSAVIGSSIKIAMPVLVFAVFMLVSAVPILNPQKRKIFWMTSAAFGGIAVFLFVFGLCLLIYEIEVNQSFLISSVVILGLLYGEVINRVDQGKLPFDTRRIINVAVPLLFVGIGYLFSRLWKTHHLFRAPAVIGVIIILSFFFFYGVPLYNHVADKGISKQIESLADKLDEDVVFFTSTSYGEIIGIPLRYQHHVDARRAWNLSDLSAFDEVVRKYNAKGKKVLIELKGAPIALLKLRAAEKRFEFKKALSYDFETLGLRFTDVGRPIGTHHGRYWDWKAKLVLYSVTLRSR